MKVKPANSDEAQRLLGACTLFSHLSSDERALLVSQARISNFTAGHLIFQMSSPGNSMMAVLRGTIRISIPSPEGKEIVLAILHAGEVFGEIALLDGKERTADAKALTDCTLAILERKSVLAFLDRHPGAWLKLVEVLCERLRRTDQQISELALLQLPSRLAKVILRFAKELPPAGAQEIQLSQRELGNFVGASRESVNKCLRDWQRLGLIRISENAIAIINAKALEQISNS